ncbi:hypothetical protein BCF11_2777 [Collimonas sp. PA-H2]|nr:hypothetical protein BCF11_2777 [Collimonas sp. PA-H2]
MADPVQAFNLAMASVVPANTGTHFTVIKLDSGMRGNEGISSTERI